MIINLDDEIFKRQINCFKIFEVVTEDFGCIRTVWEWKCQTETGKWIESSKRFDDATDCFLDLFRQVVYLKLDESTGDH